LIFWETKAFKQQLNAKHESQRTLVVYKVDQVSFSWKIETTASLGTKKKLHANESKSAI
jgi:hypothetical protein